MRSELATEGRKLVRLLVVVVMACQFALGTAWCQETHAANAKPHADEPDFIADFLNNEAEMWTAPLRWQGSDWLAAGSVAAVISLTIAFDEPIYSAFKRFQGHNAWVSTVSPIVTQLGNLGVALGIDAAIFLGGLILHDAKAKATAEMGLQALLHTGILVQVLKHVAGRSRPSFDSGVDHWYGPEAFYLGFVEAQSKYDAFPSGHAITTWSLATVIATQYEDTVWVPILCYTLAVASGLSRVTEDTHWLSDVILGGALGYAVAKLVLRNHRDRHLAILPSIAPQGALLTIQYAF
jgi:membrane-associated phospholipid phosphatase